MLEDVKSDPHPFRQFVLKIHGRCDLACSYCYVYEKLDQRWASRPRTMSGPVVAAVARRIAEHTEAHDLPWVSIVLHGGEPLLAGPRRIANIVQAIRASAPAGAELRFSIQTNGVRLDRSYITRLRDLGVRIGVSLDGEEAAHDRYRRSANGSGSYRKVTTALRELARPENASVYAGLLCTVELTKDPVRTYEELLRFRPPTVDFLLPEGNWWEPPPNRMPGDAATPYADWLVAVFDRWYDAPVRETRVRSFNAIIDVLLGGRTSVAGVGLAPVAWTVVETDGTIEVCDSLTSTPVGTGSTGLSVLDNAFDEALQFPLVRSRQGGLAALGETCRACDEVIVCGGGAHSQRYHTSTGFRNPSVYCRDLLRLITHIRGRLERDLVSLSREAPDVATTLRSRLDGTKSSPPASRPPQ